MKMNGIQLKSRGLEEVYIYRERYKRTVYYLENPTRYYVKMNNEFIEVYRNSFNFSTTKY